MRRLVGLAPRLIYLGEESPPPVPIYWEAGWAPELARIFLEKNAVYLPGIEARFLERP